MPNAYSVPANLLYSPPALGSCTESLQFPMTDDLDLCLKSYVTPANLKERRYTFRRMSHRTHLTLNSLQIFMINHSRHTPRRSLIIIATLTPTVVPLLLVNHNHPRFRRNMREPIVIRTLHAPLWMSILVTAIITTAIMAMTMTATMVIITIGSDHHLPIGGSTRSPSLTPDVHSNGDSRL